MHHIRTGSCSYVDGSKYSGEWKAGLPSGAGEQLFANGDTYVGDWEEGMMNGQVRMGPMRLDVFDRSPTGRIRSQRVRQCGSQPAR